jgi:hypothetical protein
MKPSTPYFPPLEVPPAWHATLFRTPDGYTVKVNDPRSLRSRNLKSLPVHLDHPDASLYEYRVGNAAVLLCTAEMYHKLKGTLP